MTQFEEEASGQLLVKPHLKSDSVLLNWERDWRGKTAVVWEDVLCRWHHRLSHAVHSQQLLQSSVSLQIPTHVQTVVHVNILHLSTLRSEIKEEEEGDCGSIRLITV